MIRFSHEANSWQWKYVFDDNWQWKDCTPQEARLKYDRGFCIY